MKRFQNKTVVITGGSKGIGLATATRFLDEGANVVIAARSETDLAAAAETLQAGDRLLTVSADVAEVEDLKSLFKLANDKFGAIHSLFANAGSGASTILGDTTEASFDSIVNANIKGVYFSAQEALPFMADGGSIIITSSLTQFQGNQAMSIYAATKAAVSQFTRSMTATLLPSRGIRVNAVSPGVIETGMTESVLDGVMHGRIEAQTPAGRLGRPEEVAAVVAFLASDDAGFVSAQDILVDGGRINTNLWHFD
ncbi:MAG: SDR family oxidoreductase [Parasphingorhabdus sp.]|uniref:SDR family NAD(P)-dependent oxidoreductase n=1 Tax=Parasphingorhabdus sp. TaxID=2709688 RepID=UPI003299A4BB